MGFNTEIDDSGEEAAATAELMQPEEEEASCWGKDARVSEEGARPGLTAAQEAEEGSARAAQTRGSRKLPSHLRSPFSL